MMLRRWTSPQQKPFSRYPVAVLVRCTEEERGTIHANAQQAGRSASRFLAELGALNPGAKMRAPLSPEQMEQLQTLTFHLRKLGINLNQLAHRENAADYDMTDLPTDEEVNEAVRAGRELVTPLSDEAVRALREAPRVLGSPWVVPSEKDPARRVSRSTLNAWMLRTKKAAGITVARLGCHAQKRAGVRTTEFRSLPPKMQESLTGTTHRTLCDVYDDVSVEEMREAVAQLAQARRRA